MRSSVPLRLGLVVGMVFTLAFHDARLVMAGEEPGTNCNASSPTKSTVVRIIDAETVDLDDGRQVRLIGSLAPRAPMNTQSAGSWPPHEAAEARLKALVLGQAVEVWAERSERDRYGRLLAHLFVVQDGSRQWVQGALIAEGHGRAYGLPSQTACLAGLVALEKAAREEERGLWRLPAYRIRGARRVSDLKRLRSTYQIIEGAVATASEVRGAVYLNFGADWKTDFTAFVPATVVTAQFGGVGPLKALEGKNVRVRGWLEQRNGPMIEIIDRAQIENLSEVQSANDRAVK